MWQFYYDQIWMLWWSGCVDLEVVYGFNVGTNEIQSDVRQIPSFFLSILEGIYNRKVGSA